VFIVIKQNVAFVATLIFLIGLVLIMNQIIETPRFANPNKAEETDVILLIDDSGSMSTPDAPGGISRKSYLAENLSALVRGLNAFDQDGVPFYVFYDAVEHRGMATEEVLQTYLNENPAGTTDTAGALTKVYADFKANKATAKARTVCVCVTDGQPDDRTLTFKAIIDIANDVASDSEFTILFLQVGNDPDATDFLKKCDDDLPKVGAKFDICDTRPVDKLRGVTMAQLIADAIAG
jgi:hypothetical protein